MQELIFYKIGRFANGYRTPVGLLDIGAYPIAPLTPMT